MQSTGTTLRDRLTAAHATAPAGSYMAEQLAAALAASTVPAADVTDADGAPLSTGDTVAIDNDPTFRGRVASLAPFVLVDVVSSHPHQADTLTSVGPDETRRVDANPPAAVAAPVVDMSHVETPSHLLANVLRLAAKAVDKLPGMPITQALTVAMDVAGATGGEFFADAVEAYTRVQTSYNTCEWRRGDHLREAADMVAALVTAGVGDDDARYAAAEERTAALLAIPAVAAIIERARTLTAEERAALHAAYLPHFRMYRTAHSDFWHRMVHATPDGWYRSVFRAAELAGRATGAGPTSTGEDWGAACAAEDAAKAVMMAAYITEDESRVYTGPWRAVCGTGGEPQQYGALHLKVGRWGDV